MNKNSLYDAASRIFLGQDYEFTRLNTYVKKEMSEEFPKIDFVELKVGSNNNYWIKLSSIIVRENKPLAAKKCSYLLLMTDSGLS